MGDRTKANVTKTMQVCCKDCLKDEELVYADNSTIKSLNITAEDLKSRVEDEENFTKLIVTMIED